MTSPPRRGWWRGALVLIIVSVVAACGGGDDAAAPLSALAVDGREIARSRGCVSCHSVSGGDGLGPTWKGLAGSTVPLDDGSSAIADAAYLRRSIEDPKAQIVDGFGPSMPAFALDGDELDALVAYIQALSDGS